MFRYALAGFFVFGILLWVLMPGTENKSRKISAHACGGCHSKSVSCHINPDVLKLETMKTIKRLWENTIFHATEMREPFDHGSYFSGGCVDCHPDL